MKALINIIILITIVNLKFLTSKYQNLKQIHQYEKTFVAIAITGHHQL